MAFFLTAPPPLHVTFCHFFLQHSSPLYHSPKREKQRHKIEVIFVYIAAEEYHIISKKVVKVRNYSCALTFTHRFTCIHQPCRENDGLIILSIWQYRYLKRKEIRRVFIVAHCNQGNVKLSEPHETQRDKIELQKKEHRKILSALHHIFGYTRSPCVTFCLFFIKLA